MASNPPPFDVEVEDQTDEDFFDKLVDDDFGLSGSPPNFPLPNDSNDAKAFANLTITNAAPSAFEDLTTAQPRKVDDGLEPVAEKAVVELDSNDGYPAVSTNTPVSPDPINDGPGSELRSNSMIGESSDSASAGFKEVGWSSFHANSAPNGGHGFGSYSEFFNELDGDSGEVAEKAGQQSTTEAKTVSRNEEHRDVTLNGVVNYAQHQDGQYFGASVEQATNGQDVNTSEYWESLYPGWRYDTNTGLN